jgi:hypothetical protein
MRHSKPSPRTGSTSRRIAPGLLLPALSGSRTARSSPTIHGHRASRSAGPRTAIAESVSNPCSARCPLLSTMRRCAAQISAVEFMSPSDRTFYEELPNPVPVFRDCGRRRVRGLPWTTDRKIAEFFARGGRFPPPRDPVIASAKIAKAGLFIVSVSRQESEVVLDPYLIKRPRLEVALGAGAD